MLLRYNDEIKLDVLTVCESIGLSKEKAVQRNFLWEYATFDLFKGIVMILIT